MKIRNVVIGTVLLMAVAFFVAVLLGLLEELPDRIKIKKEITPPSRLECGAYQGKEREGGSTFFYIFQEEEDGETYLRTVKLNPDCFPVKIEKGLELQAGALVCIKISYSVGGFQEEAEIVQWTR